jgi:hypothetical protein
MATTNVATRTTQHTTATAARPRPSSIASELAENSVMRVSRRGVAVVVRVDRGTVLITCQGDLEDHVLEAGDEIYLQGGGLALAWAFTDATLHVTEAEP